MFHEKEYAGQWLVVEGDQLVANGGTALEVYDAAKSAGIQIPFLVHAAPEDEHLDSFCAGYNQRKSSETHQGVSPNNDS